MKKVLYSQAIILPVIMYGCESWIIKEALCQRFDAFKQWCSPESPLERNEVKPVNPKGNPP